MPAFLCVSSKSILHRLQLFRGLAYIHTVPGVCHRDVKPQNVLVGIHDQIIILLCDGL